MKRSFIKLVRTKSTWKRNGSREGLVLSAGKKTLEIAVLHDALAVLPTNRRCTLSMERHYLSNYSISLNTETYFEHTSTSTGLLVASEQVEQAWPFLFVIAGCTFWQGKNSPEVFCGSKECATNIRVCVSSTLNIPLQKLVYNSGLLYLCWLFRLNKSEPLRNDTTSTIE